MVKTLQQATVQKEKELKKILPKPKSNSKSNTSDQVNKKTAPKPIVSDTKRHGKVKSTRIPTEVIKTLATRAKIFRKADEIYDFMRACVDSYMNLVLRTAILYTKHDHDRKTISGRDIVRAVKFTTGTRYLGKCEPRKTHIRKHQPQQSQQ